MPTESFIRKKALTELQAAGYFTWYPFDNRWAKEQDIFGVFDLVAIHFKNPLVLFVQTTTRENISARKKKVMK